MSSVLEEDQIPDRLRNFPSTPFVTYVTKLSTRYRLSVVGSYIFSTIQTAI